jgi:hypothetical protein
LIKDQVMRRIIHRGRCVGGLYPLISSLVSSNQSQKHAFAVSKPSYYKWHSRLGRPSLPFFFTPNTVGKAPTASFSYMVPK